MTTLISELQGQARGSAWGFPTPWKHAFAQSPRLCLKLAELRENSGSLALSPELGPWAS